MGVATACCAATREHAESVQASTMGGGGRRAVRSHRLLYGRGRYAALMALYSLSSVQPALPRTRRVAVRSDVSPTQCDFGGRSLRSTKNQKKKKRPQVDRAVRAGTRLCRWCGKSLTKKKIAGDRDSRSGLVSLQNLRHPPLRLIDGARGRPGSTGAVAILITLALRGAGVV